MAKAKSRYGAGGAKNGGNGGGNGGGNTAALGKSSRKYAQKVSARAAVAKQSKTSATAGTGTVSSGTTSGGGKAQR